MPHEELIDQVSDKADAKLEEMGISVSVSKSGKKRGATIFKCETCSKVANVFQGCSISDFMLGISTSILSGQASLGTLPTLA